MNKPFELKARLQSFRHAIRGIALLVKSEHNARIHALATVMVVALGAWLGVSRTDWLALVVAIALVWVAEALNTAIEFVADVASPDPDPLIGQAKDIAAGGVLLAALAAALIGTWVLGPKLLLLIGTTLPNS